MEANNKLIAEFMGKPYRQEFLEKGVGGVFEEVVLYEDLQYHSSWDWLMPVVKKIKTSVIDQDETDNPYNSEEWDKSTINYELLNNITETLVEIEIKSVYKLVVEFIKEYNEKN